MGKKVRVPDVLKFSNDCAVLSYSEIGTKYGVGRTLLKKWKHSFGLIVDSKRKHRLVRWIEMKNGCWRCISHKGWGVKAKWPAPQNVKYPSIHKNGRMVLVSKLLWEEQNGEWPRGKLVRHLCNEKSCVNPNHVVPGSMFENMVDVVLDLPTYKYCSGSNNVFGRKYSNTILTRAVERGVIQLDEEGVVVRVVDGKKFLIRGSVVVEERIVKTYKGSFEKLSEDKGD